MLVSQYSDRLTCVVMCVCVGASRRRRKVQWYHHMCWPSSCSSSLVRVCIVLQSTRPHCAVVSLNVCGMRSFVANLPRTISTAAPEVRTIEVPPVFAETHGSIEIRFIAITVTDVEYAINTRPYNPLLLLLLFLLLLRLSFIRGTRRMWFLLLLLFHCFLQRIHTHTQIASNGACSATTCYCTVHLGALVCRTGHA
jgi:hypothetical protein